MSLGVVRAPLILGLVPSVGRAPLAPLKTPHAGWRPALRGFPSASTRDTYI